MKKILGMKCLNDIFSMTPLENDNDPDVIVVCMRTRVIMYLIKRNRNVVDDFYFSQYISGKLNFLSSQTRILRKSTSQPRQ